MSNDMLIVFAAITVSWVMFIFNFVLGYYIGRSVESTEQRKQRKSKKTNQKEELPYKPFAFPRISFPYP